MRAKMPARQPDNIAKATGYQFFGSASDRAGRSLADVQAERVAWVQGYGIEAKDAPGITATLEAHHLVVMQNRTGRPPESPLLHFSISFDPKEADKATPDKQREIAGQIIERMGLAGHVGFVVSHKDEPHPHMHFVFHRVHPETGKTWEEWARPRDGEQELPTGRGGLVGCKVRLNHHTRDLAREHGFNISQEIGQGRTSEAEYHEARREGRAPFQTFTPEQRTEIRGQTLPAFREATGWADLTERLQAQGLRLGMAGKGSKAALYVYSDTHKAKLSDVFGKEKDIRTGQLAERFGQRFTDYARENGLEAPERPERAPERPEAIQEPQIALDDEGDAYSAEYARRQGALDEAIRERDAYQAEVSQQRAAEASAREAEQAAAALAARVAGMDREAAQARAEIMAAIAEAFANPAEAQKAWEQYEVERERTRRLADRAFKPERFGILRGKVRAMVKDGERRKALAAIERLKKARAQLVAARERVEVARLTLPAVQHKEQQAKRHWREWTARTGDRQEQENRLAQQNLNVREKAAALAELSREREREREIDRDDRGRDRGIDWND
ncbi:hypothetical protein EJC49_14870 [Aquibium carbonis]|uniref:MobA/VirD2-like nuclease domain-containing protein n=1 Tax=Aquibium carbonis TaxID=2495581 RepID=A0A429YVU3_9HYPH|nr:relaxase/mobilization nuclease domain-containing protein [Aquibium carbonis]RST85584.1 hypothetical protein EJC49_14870 [Aquibium carbonis]